MKDLFYKQPMGDEAPQGLRNRVELAARQKPGRDWFGARTRWAVAGTAVAAAAVGGLMFITPANAEAKTWDMVTSAYEQVRGVLIQMDFTGQGEDGNLTIAGKGGEWRVQMEGAGEDMDISYSNGTLTMWDGGDTAQVMKLGFNIPFNPEDVMKGMTEQLSASKIFEEHADEIGRDNIRIEQPTWVGNRHVYNVYIDEANGQGKVHILVDADTDLPISMTVSGPNGEDMKMKFQFDGDFDSSLLRPIIPKGVNIEEIDMSKAMGGAFNNEEFLRGMEEFGKSFEHGGKGPFGDNDHDHDEDDVKTEKSVRLERATLHG